MLNPERALLTECHRLEYLPGDAVPVDQRFEQTVYYFVYWQSLIEGTESQWSY